MKKVIIFGAGKASIFFTETNVFQHFRASVQRLFRNPDKRFQGMKFRAGGKRWRESGNYYAVHVRLNSFRILAGWVERYFSAKKFIALCWTGADGNRYA